MKKIFIFLALATLSVSACDNFLECAPGGNPTTTTYFSNDQQAIDALDYTYYRLSEEVVFGRQILWEQGAANDWVWGKTRDFNTLATFKYTGNEGPLRDVYYEMYRHIARMNFVVYSLLNKAKETELTAIESRTLGEAYFLRAQCHFYIAYRYGVETQGVPFIRYEKEENFNYGNIPPQAESVMENYRMIIEDMEEAMKYLPKFEEYGANDRGRAHDAACIAYMVKTYAYWASYDASKWDDVIRLVDSLETEYGRELAPTMATNFSSEFADFWHNEYLWSLPSEGGSAGCGTEFPGVSLEDKGWGVFNGWGQFKPSLDIWNEMLKDGEGNQRLRESILEYGDTFMYNGEERRFFSNTNMDSGFMLYKFFDPFKGANFTEDKVNPNGDWPTVRMNFPLVRFAEMLLFRAEAYLAKSQARSATLDINKIRNRSNLTPLATDATWENLYHERRCELAFEFTDHLFDLKRWHLSGAPEIKALAAAELNGHPEVRLYKNRDNPDSEFTVGPYPDYQEAASYQDYMLAFPYPADEVLKANGKLKQNPGY